MWMDLLLLLIALLPWMPPSRSRCLNRQTHPCAKRAAALTLWSLRH
jgi:hypothetical protein